MSNHNQINGPQNQNQNLKNPQNHTTSNKTQNDSPSSPNSTRVVARKNSTTTYSQNSIISEAHLSHPSSENHSSTTQEITLPLTPQNNVNSENSSQLSAPLVPSSQNSGLYLSRNYVFLSVSSCLLYSICSILMTFTNKTILTIFDFQYPFSLLFCQNCMSLMFVLIWSVVGNLNIEPIRKDILLKCLPLNLLFLLMLLTGQLSLGLLSVPMVTIFKNLQTISISLGDVVFFKNKLNFGVVSSLVLMFFSSIVAAFNDLQFDPKGYMWMLTNCFIGTCYVLYMRQTMKSTRLGELGLVFYNNLIGIPISLVCSFIFQEIDMLFTFPWSRNFLLLLFFNGIIGFLISFSSFWAVKTTSPTTYSIVGALNKIPLTLLGVLLFKTEVSPLGGASIFIGLSSGVLYSLAKHHQLVSKSREVLPVYHAQRTQNGNLNNNSHHPQEANNHLLHSYHSTKPRLRQS